MDRRSTPFSGRVAHVSLRGQVEAAEFTEGQAMCIAQPLADLNRDPGGARDRQLLWGERVLVVDRRDGHAFVMADRDGYCGWLIEGALGPEVPASHRVCTAFSQIYAEPKVTTRESVTLPWGAHVQVTGSSGAFAATPWGYIPQAHLRALDRHDTDPVALAAGFLGTSYLWGGNSRAGLDCSGLVQAVLLACGIACPGDSDQQARMGRGLAADEPVRAGDLVFWKGHVALVSGPDEIIHATGAFMQVVRESLSGAAARILAQEHGPVLHRRRIMPD